ncbi:MAG: hypothetical protein SXG53_20615 [Pseudomonadota bacterium]|nr:hypothetical protein [Pseudomonadota bacterium]
MAVIDVAIGVIGAVEVAVSGVDGGPLVRLAALLTLMTISGNPTAVACISSPLPRSGQFATDRTHGSRTNDKE